MTSESLARQHERWQDHADGFQVGWHAALQRVSEGDSVTKLRDSVPDTAPAYRAERDRLAAEHTRLREALERIADMAMTATVKGAPPLSGYRVRQIVDAALAALTPAREESPDA